MGLLVEISKRFARSPWSHWWVSQRYMFQFFLLGSFGMNELKHIFRKFQAPTAFESHVTRIRDAAAGIEWQRILWMSMSDSDNSLVIIFEDLSSLEVSVSGDVTRRAPNEDSRVKLIIWNVFS